MHNSGLRGSLFLAGIALIRVANDGGGVARDDGNWCGWRGSNPRPLASEANTLSTELQPQR
jgi:hypothetical protein